MTSEAGATADAVATQLRELLLRGDYRPGDRLPPERELAAALGVSRPTTREGLRRLVEAGLLLSRRGSGTYVADVDLEAILGVRLRLEPYAAELAARHRSAETARALRRMQNRLQRALGDPSTFAALDADLHALIAEASGNPVLVDLLGQLATKARLGRLVTASSHAVRESAAADMAAVVAAIDAGDPSAAERAMRRHLRAVSTAAARSAPLDRSVAVVR